MVDSQKNKGQWYVVQTQALQEFRIQKELEERLHAAGFKDQVNRVIVASEDVPVIRKGVDTGKTKKKNIYPGYVYIEMIMSDEAWYIVRNTRGVTGFVGSSGKGAKPFPVPREEMEHVLKRMNIVDDAMYDRYKVGDYIKVTSGTYADSEGEIESIDKETGIVNVSVVFFGRVNIIPIEFANIEKI